MLAKHDIRASGPKLQEPMAFGRDQDFSDLWHYPKGGQTLKRGP